MTDREQFMAEQILRLKRNGFNPPSVDTSDLVREWANRVYHWVDLEVFRKAVTQHINTGTYFPKPKELRAIIREISGPTGPSGLAGRYATWERDPFDESTGKPLPCPVCQSIYVTQESGRVDIHHEHQRHFEANVGYSGPRTGPCDNYGRLLSRNEMAA